MEADPGKVFEKIFGRGKTDQERNDIASDFSSVLDLVLAEMKDLDRGLGADDRVMVHDYLDSVRELERRIQMLKARDLSNVDMPAIPVASPAFDERLRLMFDLLAVAYQTNVTRVASFMMVAEVSNQSYAHVGVPDAFHPLSHHADNKASMEKLVIVQRYHSEVFANFLAKLAKTPDGDAGSMLDSSIFVYGSNMSNSNQHDSFPLPTVVFGGGNGKIKGNQHVRYPDHTPIANLLLHADAACRRARRQVRRQQRRAHGGLSTCTPGSHCWPSRPSAPRACRRRVRPISSAAAEANDRAAVLAELEPWRRRESPRGRRHHGAALGRLSRRRRSRRAFDQGRRRRQRRERLRLDAARRGGRDRRRSRDQAVARRGRQREAHPARTVRRR